MLNLSQALVTAKLKGIDIKSRSCRSEYWWMFVVLGVVTFAALIIKFVVPSFGIVYDIVSALATFILFFVSIRRLHDSEHSGWWLLVLLIPVIGTVIYFYFMILPGTSGPNKYGFDPSSSVDSIVESVRK